MSGIEKDHIDKPPRRLGYFFVGMTVMLFAGIIYAWSILKTPFSVEFHWNTAALAVNYTLTISSFCMGNFVSGLLSKRTQPRLRLILSAICLLIGFSLTSLLTVDKILILYLAYGVLAGFGIGLTYNTIVSVICLWYPDKKGLCSGALMMAFGFNALIIGRIASNMIQLPSIGWRNTFIILAAVSSAVILASAVILKVPPPGTVFPAQKSSFNKFQEVVIKDYSSPEMIRRASFWLLFVFFVILVCIGSVPIAFAKDLFISLGASQVFAITLVGVLSFFNGLGRLLMGLIFDKLGPRASQFTASAVSIISPLLVYIAIISGSLAMGLIGICLCGVAYGFCPTLIAAFSAAFYGEKNFPRNFSLVNLVLIPGSFSATAAGLIVSSTGSFSIVFLVLTGFSVIGLIINIFNKHA